MEYQPIINPLLEALAYFGRRAGGHTTQQLVDKLRSNGVSDPAGIMPLLNPLTELMQEAERQITVDSQTLTALFGNLPGFTYNTIGSSSPAFILLYAQIAPYDGDIHRLLNRLRHQSPEELAGQLALSLDLRDETEAITGAQLSARLLSLSVPAESKVAILDIYHNPDRLLEQLEPLLCQALDFLSHQQEHLMTICQAFSAEMEQLGPDQFIAQTSGLKPHQHHALRPFIFGMDTNLSAGRPDPAAPVQVYCGVLRRPIQLMLSSTRGPEYDVYNAIKLLGDRTRFDILCYLCNRTAYGHELSAHFGVSRNTIHHHMSKLLAARLVTCTVDGNRVYYTADRASIDALLVRQRALLLPE